MPDLRDYSAAVSAYIKAHGELRSAVAAARTAVESLEKHKTTDHLRHVDFQACARLKELTDAYSSARKELTRCYDAFHDQDKLALRTPDQIETEAGPIGRPQG